MNGNVRADVSALNELSQPPYIFYTFEKKGKTVQSTFNFQ